MSSSGPTLPSRPAGLPIRTLTLEVVSGADQGRTLETEGERVTVGTAEDND